MSLPNINQILTHINKSNKEIIIWIFYTTEKKTEKKQKNSFMENKLLTNGA